MFLLIAVILYHLKQQPPSRAVEELRENLYVDDFLSGADDEDDASALLRGSTEVLASAGMVLTKQQSNNANVKNLSMVELSKVAPSEGGDDSTKVLGLKWLKDQDALTLAVMKISPDIVVTKRVILSCIARLHDVLGFITPFVMTAKMLLQEVWKLTGTTQKFR